MFCGCIDTCRSGRLLASVGAEVGQSACGFRDDVGRGQYRSITVLGDDSERLSTIEGWCRVASFSQGAVLGASSSRQFDRAGDIRVRFRCQMRGFVGASSGEYCSVFIVSNGSMR